MSILSWRERVRGEGEREREAEPGESGAAADAVSGSV